MDAPLPWQQAGSFVKSADGSIVADCWLTRHVSKQTDKRAALIAHAVNNHDALVTALRSARARLATVFEASGRDPRDDATVREIDAAIEKATGE
jgi:hypothetical protein